MRKFSSVSIFLIVIIFSCKSQDKKKETNQGSTSPAVKQTGWNNSYGGADKTYDTVLLKMRDQVAPTFQTFAFKDQATGRTMTYHLFIPKNYDKSKSYPLVLFMADASTVGKGALAPLMQGYGGIIWASAESQAKNPSFVLVPSYKGPENAVNDNWETSAEVAMTLRLLDAVVAQYRIDKNRLYTTGQSMGGMMSFYFNANHPDLFAASLFVGSQWDINVLEPLAKMKFFYVVSAGDEKAAKGMQELGAMLDKKGVEYGKIEFSAKLAQADQEERIIPLISKGHAINFVQFTAGTVTPKGVSGGGSEHMYSFDYAYKLESIRDWLFKQIKK